MLDRPDIQSPTLSRTRTLRRTAITLSTLFATLVALAVPQGAHAVDNPVNVSVSSGTVTTADQCVTVSFTLHRTDATAARTCEVRFKLDKLQLCGAQGDKALGDWGSTFSGRAEVPFVPYPNNEYSYGANIAGGGPTNCGPTGDGVVFTVKAKAGSGVTNDTGTITVVSVTLLDCVPNPLNTGPGTAGSVTINIGGTQPSPLGSLTAEQQKQNNNPFTPPQPGGPGRYINFQPQNVHIPTGYEADVGATFNTTRGYGWFSTVIPVSRVVGPGDPSYDDPSYTFVKKMNSNNPARWEIVLANGHYSVRVGVGDAATQGTHVVKVEGQTFFGGVLTQGGQFESSFGEVTISDGRLTVDIGGAYPNVPSLTETKIDLIEIDPVVSKSGNSGEPGIASTNETTYITLTWTAPSTGEVKIYRTGYGDYPEYASGSVPTLPTYTEATAPGSRWHDINATTSPFKDRVPDRDFYYYVAFVVVGGVASTGVMTDGTLNYHLGDVDDRVVGTVCIGNDSIEVFDVSLMAAHYATVIGDPLYLPCLDIAPTTNSTSPLDGRPVPDGHINILDLVYGAVNFFMVSKSGQVQASETVDDVALEEIGPVRAGERVDVALQARGTGRVQGMSIGLDWDPAIVRPVGMTAGTLLEDQHGMALSPQPGMVDVVLLGARSTGLVGAGELATVQFEAIGAGDPAIRLARIEALDVNLQPIEVQMRSGGTAGSAPRVTELLQNTPNPFNPTTKFTFSLATTGPVDLSVFAVDGRLIRRLVQDVRNAGRYEVTWDGTDSRGVRVGSGVYFARLTTPDVVRKVTVSLVK